MCESSSMGRRSCASLAAAPAICRSLNCRLRLAWASRTPLTAWSWNGPAGKARSTRNSRPGKPTKSLKIQALKRSSSSNTFAVLSTLPPCPINDATLNRFRIRLCLRLTREHPNKEDCGRTHDHPAAFFILGKGQLNQVGWGGNGTLALAWRVCPRCNRNLSLCLPIRDSLLCRRGSSAHGSGCAGLAGAGDVSISRKRQEAVTGALRLDSARGWRGFGPGVDSPGNAASFESLVVCAYCPVHPRRDFSSGFVALRKRMARREHRKASSGFRRPVAGYLEYCRRRLVCPGIFLEKPLRRAESADFAGHDVARGRRRSWQILSEFRADR